MMIGRLEGELLGDWRKVGREAAEVKGRKLEDKLLGDDRKV